MRKYFIAGAAALMVFAIVAFAASLAVDGGVLQAGMYELEDGGNATVEWVTVVGHSGDFYIQDVVIKFDDADAIGQYGYINAMSGPGSIVIFASGLIVEDPDNPENGLLKFASEDVKAEDIATVSVMVKNTSDAAPDDYFFGSGITGYSHGFPPAP